MLNRLGPVSVGQPFKQISIQKGFVQVETTQLMTVCEEYFFIFSCSEEKQPKPCGLTACQITAKGRVLLKFRLNFALFMGKWSSY